MRSGSPCKAAQSHLQSHSSTHIITNRSNPALCTSARYKRGPSCGPTWVTLIRPGRGARSRVRDDRVGASASVIPPPAAEVLRSRGPSVFLARASRRLPGWGGSTLRAFPALSDCQHVTDLANVAD
jgi:hypothetical protein